MCFSRVPGIFPLRQSVVPCVTASSIVELCELEDTQAMLLKAERPRSQENTLRHLLKYLTYLEEQGN